MRSFGKPRLRHVIPLAAIVLAMLSGACSSESAVEECEALVDAYCAAWARCTTTEGQEEAYRASYAQCELQSSFILACGDAESTSPRYDECLAEIASIRCTFPFGIQDNAIPRSCIGAIRLK